MSDVGSGEIFYNMMAIKAEEEKERKILIAAAKATARKKDIVILPYGKYGKLAKKILNECLKIREKMIIDNYKADGNLFLFWMMLT